MGKIIYFSLYGVIVVLAALCLFSYYSSVEAEDDIIDQVYEVCEYEQETIEETVGRIYSGEGVEESSEINTEIVSSLEEICEVEEESESVGDIPDMAFEYYTIAGKRLNDDIYSYLAESLLENGIIDWLPYALCQAHQESGFNPLAENKNGLDKGLFQYRITYWDFSKGDIFDWHAQIDKYVKQVANRINSGLSIEETISRHYTSDYVTEIDEKYVADVLSWMNRIEVE